MPRPRLLVRAVESAVREAVRQHGLQGRILVTAVSAGADSTALLHALYSLRDAMGLTLHVAHFDHNFRPEAAEDARFVAEMADRLGLPFITEHADPVAYQRDQGISSFEAAARELRYRFLGRVVDSVGAWAVALGHNADDQAETVLMHLIRGSGLDGLRGMDAISTWLSSDVQQQVNLFRPLLSVTKEQLRSYCEEQGITYREDPANRDMRFTRNRVRHQLLPSLREYNPRISESLVRLGQSVSEDADFLDGETERAWGELVREARDAVILDRQALSLRPRALQTRLLRRAYFQLAGSLRRLQSSHVEAMLGLLGSAPGREVALPMDLRLTSTYDTVTMGRAVVSDTSTKPLEGAHRLEVPVTAAEVAVTHIPGWCVTVGWVDVQDGIPTEALEAILDLGEDVSELWVRRRRRGDRFRPYGMSNEKKLQDFLVNRKVPSAERDAVPLVFHGERLAWVVGHRVAEWAAVSHASRRVLRIRFEASNPSSA